MQVRTRRFLAILSLAVLLNCSNKSQSTIRVRNDRSTKANVQFKDASANTTNINDVAAGTASTYLDIATGPYTVTAIIQNETVSPTLTFTVLANESYTLVVVAGATPTLRADRP